ncbi:protein ABHD13 [Ischnura elegans]|uniref:protein ABHD13 n=1 Tax=Ischnura elegans TaxID=197161 RepID=UPI001ED8B3D2|nr:protein ABHD13 [Ischnura elegans]
MSIRLSTSCTKLLKFVAAALMKCWALSSAAVIACFFLYWVYGGFLAFLLLCFATTGILYHTEDQLLFHPDQPSHSRVFVPVPTMFGLPYENIYIRSLDGVMLHLFFIHQTGELKSQVPTILFLHGNAGNMGHRLQNIVGLYQHVRCNILMLEYRGYGLSQGSPTEDGLNMDARAALNYLTSRRDINTSEIIVFGRSLGGAVAIDLSSQPEYASKIWCLILENTFTSIPDMAAVLLGWRVLNYLPLFCYKNKFLSQAKVQKLGVPSVLFVSGLADTLVPPRMMCELHSLTPVTQKQLLQFGAGGHNDTWSCPGYYRSIANFIQDCRVRCRQRDHRLPAESRAEATTVSCDGDTTAPHGEVPCPASLPLTHLSTPPPPPPPSVLEMGPLRPAGPGPPRPHSPRAASTIMGTAPGSPACAPLMLNRML